MAEGYLLKLCFRTFTLYN